jgi:hypothetical protein
LAVSSAAILFSPFKSAGYSAALERDPARLEWRIPRASATGACGTMQSPLNLPDMKFQLPAHNELNYLIIDRLGRFIWIEELLGSGPGKKTTE